MGRRLAYLGVVLVVVGAAVLAGPTVGFSTTAADRTTQVGTAPDDAALVGFEATSESIDGRQDTATAFYLRNNADETLTLTTDNVLSTADVRVATDGSGTIAPGSATQVVLECNGGGSSGTATLTTTVLDASGTSLSIQDADASTTVSYTCTGNSNDPLAFEADDPDGMAETQLFRFDVGALKNNDEATIDLSDAQTNSGVDYSNAVATIVSGQNGQVSFDTNTYELSYDPQGNPSGTLEIELSNLQFTGDQSGTAYYSDTTGRQSSDSFSVPYVVSDTQNGDIDTAGDVVLQAGATANDDIDAGGNLTGGDDVTVHGTVSADGDVELGDTATLNNGLTASGSFTVGADSTLNGDLDVGGTVDIGTGSTVNDDLTAGNDVTLEDDVTVHGDVTVDGTLYLGCNVVINGQVDADQQVNTC